MSPFDILVGLTVLFALLLGLLSFGKSADEALNRLFVRAKKQKK